MTNDGIPTLGDLDHLDMRQFHSAMEAVANFFEGLTDALDEAFSLRDEVASEFLSDLYSDGYE